MEMEFLMEVNKALLLSNMLSSTESIENAEIASFNASCVSPLDITIDIDPVQEGSGDPAPDNIRPISGWTGAKVTRTGANVWDEEWENGYYQAHNGAKQHDSNYVMTKNKIRVTPSTTYYVYSPIRLEIFEWGADGSYLRRKTNNVSNAEFTTSADCYYITFDTYDETTTYAHNISINRPSSVHAYNAYQGQTITVQLGQTVYGGTLNVETGELVVDRGIVKLSEFSFSQYSTPSTHVFRATFTNVIPNVKPPATNVSDWDGLCDTFSYKPYNPLTASDNGKYAITTTSTNRVVFIDHRYSSAEDFENANADVTIVYPLVTPVTMTLTPVEIHSLLGYNNVWADTGNVSVRNITCNADFLELLLKTKLIGDY